MGPPGIRVPIALIHRLRRGRSGGKSGGNDESHKTSAEGSSHKKSSEGSSHKKSSEGSSHKKSEGSGHCRSGSAGNKVEMDSLLGLLKVRIKRGINLAVRDARSSDPYVIVKMGKQKLRTHVLKRDVNPEWNEDLTLYVSDPSLPIKVTVYDHDTFSKDDKMGYAEIDIKHLLEALKMDNHNNSDEERIVARVPPGRSNCLAAESCVVIKDGKVTQDMCLRLKNVESGEVDIQIQWINLPSGSKQQS
ncbi:PREDICTED: GTPase activating protein 1-like [Ipomoea nil]|uniref:GTPase activating protein 1-like n=1 Tax=Ipomoea nil TaxID=35883 RepID=UPI000901E302|nr:PREDICTED: GTPase activating protein 1-like [Ipomoea nil]